MKRAGSILGLLLTGCTVGPDYHRPDLPVPNSFSSLPATQGQAPFSMPVAAGADLSQWWLQFGDAELQNLITRALKSNLDLLVAASRVREAREQEIIAGAAGLPQINARGLAAGSHSEANAVPSGPLSSNLFSLGFDATWEVDLFGGARRSLEAAQANTEAAVWKMRDGQVMLTAELATDYIMLRATQERIAVLRDQAEAQQKLLQMIRARAGAGFVTELDVNQQSSLTDSTSAQIPELEANAHALEHAIAVLLAENPDAMAAELDPVAAIPTIPSTLPIGLPSALLRRRPDVRVAERELQAATANVGVAVSDLYPKFNLFGAVAIAGGGLGNLVSPGNPAEAGLGAITWPILHWGQDQANVRAKQEEAQQSYYAYQKTVLGAVQNVEDALARYTTEQQRLVQLERSESSAKLSTAIATEQFRVGAVTYVNVLTAEVADLIVREQLAESRQVFATDLISLYKALGGGWAADTDNADGTQSKGSGALSGPIAGNSDPSPGLVSNLDHPSLSNGANDARETNMVTDPTIDRRFTPVPLVQNSDARRSGLFADTTSENAIVTSGLRSSVQNNQRLSDQELQLGSWRSEAAAMQGWNRIISKADGLLSGLDPRITVADLPGKGRYYRLRTGLARGVDPAQLCQELVAKGLECLLRPG